MRQQDTEQDILRSTCIFMVFLLLAGLVNLMGFSGIAELESLMASCNYLIYVGLLLYWFRSVRDSQHFPALSSCVPASFGV